MTTAVSAADAGIHKKNLRIRNNNLIISNDEMEDIIKIVKSLEDSGLLLKGVSETIQNEAKGQKGGFLSMLFGTLDASLLGNILAGKGAIAKSDSEETKLKRQGQEKNRAGEGIVRVIEIRIKQIFNAASSFN